MSFIDLASGRELGRAPTGPMPHEIAISPDGRQAAVVAYGGRTIDIFDVARRDKLRTIDLSPNEGRTASSGSTTGGSSPPPSAASR